MQEPATQERNASQMAQLVAVHTSKTAIIFGNILTGRNAHTTAIGARHAAEALYLVPPRALSAVLGKKRRCKPLFFKLALTSDICSGDVEQETPP